MPQLKTQLKISQIDTHQIKLPQFKKTQIKKPQIKKPQIKKPQIKTPQLKTPQIKTIHFKTTQLEMTKLGTSVFKALSGIQRQELERKINHIFVDSNLLWEALQAHGNGVVQIGSRTIEDGNKKMAMLGDTILQLVVHRDWFVSGISRQKGNSKLCGIASNRNLDKCGRDAGLERYINPHRSFRRGEIPPKTMAATVEAIIGAVFVDSGENLMAVKAAMVALGLI